MLNKQGIFNRREENPGQSRPSYAPPLVRQQTPAGPDEELNESSQMNGEPAQNNESRLIVGANVKLKGAQIEDCDTLIVEGRVDATMDSRILQIAEKGAFSGKVGIDIAEVYGSFEGELTARKQLIIHASGRVTGKIRYGRILIHEGGEISGDVQAQESAANKIKSLAGDTPANKMDTKPDGSKPEGLAA